MNKEPVALSAVPSTLRIPLAARAYGGDLFPELAVNDEQARQALQFLGDDGSQWLRDRQSVYGTLMRTQRFRDQARAFIAAHPYVHVFNLGCGLSNYLQWIDNNLLHMTDADLPEVIALRQGLVPPQNTRHTVTALDLNDPDWWDALGLPSSRNDAPVFLMSEGVFMYLPPETVQAVLATFGARAPAGSVFTFDAMCWLTMGRAQLHTSVKHTQAQFQWGPRKLTDVTAPHPRLQLQAAQEVMGSYNLAYKLIEPLFKAVADVPFYAVYTLSV